MDSSALEKENSDAIRLNIKLCREAWTPLLAGKKVLEVGPEHEVFAGADTLGLTEGCTYTADITRRTPIEDNAYDAVICTEVLEHVVDPFAAVAEMRRILKPDGTLLASAPFAWRIHGPIPDLWRFTEHGWGVLLKDWDSVQISPVIRGYDKLSPLSYFVSASCNKTKDVDPRTIEWRWL